MTKRFPIFACAFVALAGCSMMSKSPAGSSGGSTATGGGGAARAPLGDTMADAVLYARGATIMAPALCHTSGYAKLAIPAGETVHFDVTVASSKDEACISIGYLKENGGAGGISDEVCSSATKSYDVTAPEGAMSFLQLSENGVCQGATLTIAIK